MINRSKAISMFSCACVTDFQLLRVPVVAAAAASAEATEEKCWIKVGSYAVHCSCAWRTAATVTALC